MSKTSLHYLFLMLRGMAMGAADVVPGVSGGTIAFITGIYEELINSLKSIGIKTLIIWKQQGFASAWYSINGNFLLSVFSGVIISMLTLAKIIDHALHHHPILVWSFFWGLVLASIWHLYKEVKFKGLTMWAWMAFGAFVALGVSIAKPAALPGDWWILMIGGAVAICAMILPGISGSFILLLMGLYPVFIEALSTFNIVLLASFGIGCALGLIGFSRLLSWLLKRYHNKTLALLTGFLIGSLNVIWPWKIVLETKLDRHGDLVPVVQENVLPWEYAQTLGEPSQLYIALAFALIGFASVLSIEVFSKKWEVD
ncbi:DUF368 domain-containing protein [Sessilibacter corallicola]|uniref:DUF368 domain-containing protein n=1 Tax=Sessilibacter corallicola TaxID=2904075 RepID=A0ABQ0A3U5_9GAMM|nr:DUF368 domain-containing protein [Sessilibacter corallicola]MCE2027054.1 DUF368 domain-containing protein [Sessilibacter corallicola]